MKPAVENFRSVASRAAKDADATLDDSHLVALEQIAGVSMDHQRKKGLVLLRNGMEFFIDASTTSELIERLFEMIAA